MLTGCQKNESGFRRTDCNAEPTEEAAEEVTPEPTTMAAEEPEPTEDPIPDGYVVKLSDRRICTGKPSEDVARLLLCSTI